MKKSQVAGLLAAASAFDNRRLTPEQVEAWHELVGDLDAGDAMEAMKRHFKASHEYLMPVHIVEGVAEIRRERSWEPPVLSPAEAELCAVAGVPPEEFVERRSDVEWVAHLKSKWLGVER